MWNPGPGDRKKSLPNSRSTQEDSANGARTEWAKRCDLAGEGRWWISEGVVILGEVETGVVTMRTQRNPLNRQGHQQAPI